MESLTFAIPYYRDIEYLNHTLDSVLRQSTNDWTAFVADDGDDARTAALVASYRHPRIKYFANESRLGMAANWNACLARSRTALVTILHADDMLKPDYAATMIDSAARHPDATLLFCAAEIVDAAGKTCRSLPDWYKGVIAPFDREISLRGIDGVKRLIGGNFIFAPSICYRRERVAPFRFDPARRFVTDFDLVLRVLFAGGEIVGTPEVEFQYRRHLRSTTEMLSQEVLRFQEEIDLYNWMARQLKERGDLPAYRRAKRKTVVKLNLLYWIAKHLARGEFGAAGAKVRLLIGN